MITIRSNSDGCVSPKKTNARRILRTKCFGVCIAITLWEKIRHTPQFRKMCKFPVGQSLPGFFYFVRVCLHTGCPDFDNYFCSLSLSGGMEFADSRNSLILVIGRVSTAECSCLCFCTLWRRSVFHCCVCPGRAFVPSFRRFSPFWSPRFSVILWFKRECVCVCVCVLRANLRCSLHFLNCMVQGGIQVIYFVVINFLAGRNTC